MFRTIRHTVRRFAATTLLVLGAAGLAACDVLGEATPPAPTRTPAPPPALSPITQPTLPGAPGAATAPAGTPGTPGTSTPQPGLTPRPGTTPDRTATPPPGTPGTGTPALSTPGATTTPGPAGTGGFATVTRSPGPGQTAAPATAQATTQGATGSGLIELTGHRGARQGSDFVVSGEVRNDTAGTPPRVRITATVYDASGATVASQEAVLTGDAPFRPGDQRSFSFRFPNGDGRIARYYVDIDV
jgi:hypothetical protein